MSVSHVLSTLCDRVVRQFCSYFSEQSYSCGRHHNLPGVGVRCLYLQGGSKIEWMVAVIVAAVTVTKYSPLTQFNRTKGRHYKAVIPRLHEDTCRPDTMYPERATCIRIHNMSTDTRPCNERQWTMSWMKPEAYCCTQKVFQEETWCPTLTRWQRSNRYETNHLSKQWVFFLLSLDKISAT